MDGDKTELLQKLINESKKVVFFGGAGVSTESGLKDFRSIDGLYNEKYDYPPEEILSRTFFINNTKEFFRFYYDKLLVDGIKPNKAHYKLAEMERSGKLTAVITQNIDGLHQSAGSKTVYELHGSVKRNYCLKCGKFYDDKYISSFKGEIPVCECGGLIKPDVVLYEEALNDETVSNAIQAIGNTDTLIVAGTSLTVYPASGLIRYFNGKNLILINKTSTSVDKIANLCIYDKVGEVLDKIKV